MHAGSTTCLGGGVDQSLRLIWSGVIERVLRRDAVGTAPKHRTRSALVAVQVGISVILLVTAALHLQRLSQPD